MSLRVGFIAYGLDRPLSGVTRVALELGRALRARDDVEPVFLTPYRRGPFAGGSEAIFLPGCRLLPGLMALGGPLLAALARRHRLDVVHDPIGVSPFTLGRWSGRYRRVVTLHDAIAFEYPQGYPWLNNLLHRRYVPMTLGNVDAVVTDSLHARAALAQHLGLESARVPVVPLGVSPSFRRLPASEARAVAERLGLPGRYILYLGAFQARKNVLGLLDAFARARGRLGATRLVLVGPRQWAYPALAERLSRDDVREAVTVLGYAPEADLPGLYGAARAFVLPSLYEGFGIPILEAMACGTPVISSTAASLPEVAGDAALTVDPRDVDGISSALVRVATDDALAADLSRRGLERAAEFTWERTAAAYAAIYRSLL